MKFFIKHKNMVTNVTGAISGCCILFLGYLSTYNVEVPVAIKVAVVGVLSACGTISQLLIGKKPEDVQS